MNIEKIDRVGKESPENCGNAEQATVAAFRPWRDLQATIPQPLGGHYKRFPGNFLKKISFGEGFRSYFPLHGEIFIGHAGGTALKKLAVLNKEIPITNA